MVEEKVQTLLPPEELGKEPVAQIHNNEMAAYWLSALIDSAEDAIISKTPDGIITSWNKGAERIFGYTAEEIIGKPVLILIPPDRQDEEVLILEKIRAGQRIEHYETVRVRKDGSFVDISLTISPIKGPDGRIIGASKIARDITKLKKSERTLRDSENQLKLITNALPALISYVDRQQVYRFVNRGYSEWFGLPADRIVGRPVWEVIGEEAYASVLPKMESALAGESLTFEQQIPHPGSKDRFTLVNYVPDIDPETGEVKGFCALIQDITESKRAEARLREYEARFVKAFNSSPLSVTISSLETGKLLEVNDTFVNVTGFSREEAIGRTALELGLWAKPLDREQEMETVRRTGKIRNAEYRFRVRDGREVIGLLSAEQIEINGEPFALTVIEDITGRKRAEEERERFYERFRLAEIASKGFIYEWSLATGLVEPSKQVTDVLGYLPEELNSKAGIWRRLIHHDDLVRVLETFQKIAVTRGTTYTIEYRIRHKDGHWVYVEDRGIIKRDERGEAGLIIGFSVDITARRITEQKLRENEERLRLFIEHAPAAVAMFDSQMRYLAVSRRWLQDYRLNSEIIGRSHYEIFPDLPESWKEIYRRCLEGAVEKSEEDHFVRRDGSINWIKWEVRPWYTKLNEIGGIVIFSEDVTERKKAEQERDELLKREQAARQQAEEANRLKEDFLATVSHELRTPLNAIIGWSHILSSGQFKHTDISRAIDAIYRNAKSQAQIIEDILDVSRIITGKTRLDSRPISLAPIIQAAVESLRPAIDAKHIRLQMRLDYEPQMVYADPGRMQQVVWNLVSNAVKFTPENGQVIVELSSTETHTKIVVSDNGQGISPEFLPHVFERFRQADSSSTRSQGGLGLGLAIVRHIVELHGGTVEVYSPGENQGAVFTVNLPLSKSSTNNGQETELRNTSKSRTDDHQSARYQSTMKGLRILLLDDETDTLELLSIALSRCGANIKTETTVRDALETVQQWLPDVIISDIAIPEEDGFSFIRRLRALPPEEGGTIPAIALTAYVGIKERTEVLSSGFQMFVPKPVEPSELLEAVASLMSEPEKD